MTDDQREKEDLFEDLDKFFAPIQDVEWPEPTETSSTRRGREEDEAPEEPEMEREPSATPTPSLSDTQAFEGPLRIEETEPEPEEPAEPEAPAMPEGPGDREPGGPFVMGTEPPKEDLEPEAEAPPWSAGDLEEGLGLEEEGVAGADVEEVEIEEEPPTDEDLEAAAEHFASSLRVEEGSVEPQGPSVPAPEDVEQRLLADLGEPAPTPRTVKVGAEGLGGPSWQEPTSVDVGLEVETRPPGRDVPAAFMTGLVLAVLAIGSLALSKGAFAVVAGILVLVAQGELYGVMHKRHLHPATAVGLITGALVLAAGYYKGEAAMLAMLWFGTMAAYLWYMASPGPHRRNVTANVALTMLPVVYVALLAGYALTTLALPKPPDGRALLLAVLGLTFVYDTAAFVVGYFWGSRPLAPTVSPKKSWEGAIGATLVVIAVSVGIVASAVDALDTVGRSVGLALVVALFAPLGDLAESLLKRDLGVKDMGSILPGHGGVLDRIDSILFVAPAALVFFRLVLV